MEQFAKVEDYFQIEGYIIKGIQMLIFTFVILVLIYQRCKGKRVIGAISIFIAVLSLLDGAFCTVRIYTMYPIEVKTGFLCIIFVLEEICFFGAIWLFVITYYETAIDLEQIQLSKEQT